MQAILRNLPITQIKLFLARILYMITTLIFGKKKRIIRRNGLNFEIDPGEGLDLSLFLFGQFQKHVAANPYITLPADGTIFDVGANVGIMALQFARLVPEGKVYAFEPTHYAFNRLKKNLSLNPSITNVVPVQTFVSAQTTKTHHLKAYSSWKVDQTNAKNTHPVHGGTAMPAENVQAVSLDDFCKHENIARVDFIKIDTDGYEMEVLAGAAGCIRTSRPQIIFEIGLYVMEEHGISFSDYWNFFTGMNYELFNSANKRMITLSNYKKIIPAKGTIDILALPVQK